MLLSRLEVLPSGNHAQRSGRRPEALQGVPRDWKGRCRKGSKALQGMSRNGIHTGGLSEHQYQSPDTSDKLEEESWIQYWDRKRIELHGTKCGCLVCRLANLGIGDEPT